MLFHAFVIRPEAGEETRGYLHGGLFIDFIGQAPVSVTRLVSFDFVILLIDFVMLGLIIERVKIKGTPASSPTTTNSDSTTDTNSQTEDSQSQDHDSEERGVRRQEGGGETPPSTRDRPDSPQISSIDDEVVEERTTLLADPTEAESGNGARGGHPMDTFASGEAVIVSMSFFGTIRDQWRHSNAPARPTTGFVPSPETATFLRQRFGLQVGTNGRIERVGT